MPVYTQAFAVRLRPTTVQEGFVSNNNFSFRNLAMTALLLGSFLVAVAPAFAQNGFTSQTPEFTQNVKTVLFPFNVYKKVVNPDVLSADADWLKSHPDAHFWIQGRADSRGDVVYNLALSYRRAQFIKNDLLEKGVGESQIGFATGWGKLYPVCGRQ